MDKTSYQNRSSAGTSSSARSSGCNRVHHRAYRREDYRGRCNNGFRCAGSSRAVNSRANRPYTRRASRRYTKSQRSTRNATRYGAKVQANSYNRNTISSQHVMSRRRTARNSSHASNGWLTFGLTVSLELDLLTRSVLLYPVVSLITRRWTPVMLDRRLPIVNGETVNIVRVGSFIASNSEHHYHAQEGPSGGGDKNRLARYDHPCHLVAPARVPVDFTDVVRRRAIVSISVNNAGVTTNLVYMSLSRRKEPQSVPTLVQQCIVPAGTHLNNASMLRHIIRTVHRYLSSNRVPFPLLKVNMTDTKIVSNGNSIMSTASLVPN